MFIEIENNQLDYNNFPNRNNSDARWYTVSQSALLFRDGEKYPDKFELNIIFSGNQDDQKSAVAFDAGKYELDEKAFYINQRNQLALDPVRLRALVK